MADAVSGLTNSTANYATKDSDRVMGSSSTGNNYNAVFTDESDNSILDPDQFLNLLVLQMQNQDFMNPMDDTTYITQMTQFSNMQQMQKMAEYSQTSYAMSLVGKTVTASRIQVNGSLDTTTGVVDKVSLLDGEYVLYVGGKTYTRWWFVLFCRCRRLPCFGQQTHCSVSSTCCPSVRWTAGRHYSAYCRCTFRHF